MLLGRIYLRNGQTAAAIDAFKIALWSQESVAGHIALAQAYLQNKDDAERPRDAGARARARAECRRAGAQQLPRQQRAKDHVTLRRNRRSLPRPIDERC